MASKYQRNAVITGCVNSFCLACQNFLRSEMDVNKHIDTVEHLEKLRFTPYFEKYKDDRIRKVLKGYYCEFCNILMSTASKVSLHVTEIIHNKNKGTQLLKPLGNSVIAYGDIVINEKAWHSLIDTACVICNIEFDDEDVHKNETTHLLNLVLTKVEFGENNGIYRKIDSSSFQCLTCNIMCALSTITKHFTEPEHEKLYSSCRFVQKQNEEHNKTVMETPLESLKKNEQTKSMNIQTNGTNVCANFLDANKKHPVDTIKNNESTKSVNLPINCEEDLSVKTVQYDTDYKTKIATSKENTARILDSIIKDQKNEINVNFETETVFCKKCFKHLKFLADDIESHIEEHTKYPSNIKSSLSYPSNIEQNYSKTILVQTTNEESTLSSGMNQTFVAEVDQNRNEVTEDCLNKGTKKIIHTELLDAKPLHEDTGNNATKSNTGTKIPKKNEEVPETSVKTAELDDPCIFAKQNKITYNSRNNNAFCRICETRLPSSLRSMKEHVSGKDHKNKAVKLSDDKPKIFKRTMKIFIDEAVILENFFHHDALINEKLCLSYLSFLMITRNGLTLRCQVCEVTLTAVDVDSHIHTSRHETAMLDTPVVTNLDTEFIREVRPGLFHCGFCNLILPNWSDLENHLKCSEHKDNKRCYNYRLKDYLPGVIQHRKRRELMILRCLFGGPLF